MTQGLQTPRCWRTRTVSLVLSLLAVLPVFAQEEAKPSVFDLPQAQARYVAAQQQIISALQKKDFAAAETLCREVLKAMPNDGGTLYNLACIQALQGRKDEAFQVLEQAFGAGYFEADHLEKDADLAVLREDGRYAALVQRMREAREKASRDAAANQPDEPPPAMAKNGVVTVEEQNVRWDPGLGVFRVFLKAESNFEAPICKGYGKAGDLLREWQKDGSAAGSVGDFYDNRDSDHSNMSWETFPQLTRIEYGEAAKKHQLHYGLPLRLLFNGIVIGNSSTALTNGPFWRSQVRYALTLPDLPALLSLHYFGNHLYVYPEHRDHDPEGPGADGKPREGHGDVFFCNIPYVLISQGSSGSDQPFLNAAAAALAAFAPEVKQELARRGLIAPALQMLLRRSQKNASAADDYFTGKAHPTVFDSTQLDEVRLVTLAHEMKPDSLPPAVILRVKEEDPMPTVGVDCFDSQTAERIFDTPCAISRVAKSTRYWRRMVVSAEASRDADGKPLTFRWAVLRGKAEEIEIKKLNEAGSLVELRIPWHQRRPVWPGADISSNRVDIGAFASNGSEWSAPAFVSIYFPANEIRTYSTDGRLLSIDYTNGNYADPLLCPSRNWRDERHYDDAGTLTGWTRFRGEKREEFTADGRLIVKPATDGQPAETKPVKYLRTGKTGEAASIEQQNG